MNGSGDAAAVWVALASCQCLLLALSGCTSSAVKVHPVRGKVELKDGDVGLLTGGHVELMQESDQFTHPSGKIEPSGVFTIQTLHQGKILPGAPEGIYKARIILGDESDAGVPKRKGDPIHKRFLDFETSKLSLTVPSGDYTVAVSKK